MDAPLAALPVIALVIIFILLLVQEACNGFHDVGGAIVAVIYSNALKPLQAVLMAASLNFIGVLVGGTAVAFSMVNLLPPGMVAGIDTLPEVSFFLALILSAVIWNLTTWYFGIPNSTTHTYIGAIMGVSFAHALVQNAGVLEGVNWHLGEHVMLALLLSPVLAFVLGLGVYALMKRLVRSEALFKPHDPHGRPPGPVKGLLIAGSAGISLMHGTNDGQKSIGLMLLVLIGIGPALFGIDRQASPETLRAAEQAIQSIEQVTRDAAAAMPADDPNRAVVEDAMKRAGQAKTLFGNIASLNDMPDDQVRALRQELVFLKREASVLSKRGAASGVITPAQATQLKQDKEALAPLLENVPFWLIVLSAACLGIGTAFGYRRIVRTLAEQMASEPMNAAHGTAAQLTTILSIGAADLTGMPVSTSQLNASGIAGAMKASGATLQGSTLQKIILTWLVTLPGSLLFAMTLALMIHAVVV